MKNSNPRRHLITSSYCALLVAGSTFATAHAAVEIYELSTASGGNVVVSTGANSFSLITSNETFADPLSGVTTTATNQTTAFAGDAFGSFAVALGTSTNVVVCKENGQWIPKRQAFAIGPYAETAAFQPFTRITTGSFALSADGAVQVYNNIVDRMPTFVPDQLNARYMTRTLSFSVAALSPGGVSTPAAVTYGGPALAIDIPSFRAFSTQSVTGTEFKGTSNVNFTLKAAGSADQIPPSCLSSNTKALAPAVGGGMPVEVPPGGGSQTGGGSTGAPGSGSSSGGGATTSPATGGNSGGAVMGPGSGGTTGGNGNSGGTQGGDVAAAPSSGTSAGQTSSGSGGGSGGGSLDWLVLAAMMTLAGRCLLLRRGRAALG